MLWYGKDKPFQEDLLFSVYQIINEMHSGDGKSNELTKCKWYPILFSEQSIKIVFKYMKVGRKALKERLRTMGYSQERIFRLLYSLWSRWKNIEFLNLDDSKNDVYSSLWSF